jgi:hypothetical protein
MLEPPQRCNNNCIFQLRHPRLSIIFNKNSKSKFPTVSRQSVKMQPDAAVVWPEGVIETMFVT